MAECARPRAQRRKKGENSGNSPRACLVDMAAPEDGRTPPPSLRPCMNALILVDVQNDFLPGGALPVPAGDQIIPVVNRLQPHFDVVVATQDWHPANHGSFAASHPGKQPGDIIELNGLPQILWPVHCVQHTSGAALVPGLHTTAIAQVFQKGADPGLDSYSGFFDNGHRHSTGLADFLKERRVGDLFVVGLATDYCVKLTALDAVTLGFKTHLIEDACRGVNLQPGDVTKSLEEMNQAGVTLLTSTQLLDEQKTTN